MAVVGTALLGLLVAAAPPALYGVRSPGPEAARSELVRLSGPAAPAEPLLRFEHLPGWPPLVSVRHGPTGGRVLSVERTEVSGPGDAAELWVQALDGRGRRRLAAAVPSRQPALWVGDEVLHVRLGPAVAGVEGPRRRSLHLGEAELLRADGLDLLWPVAHLADPAGGRGDALVLSIGGGRARLRRLPLEPGASGRKGWTLELGPRPVRDLHLGPDAAGRPRLVFHRRAAGGSELVELDPETGRVLAERPVRGDWPVPRRLAGGLLHAESEGWSRGRLIWVADGGEPRAVPRLGPGAPVPEAALGRFAAVRMQGPGGHRWLLLDGATVLGRLDDGGGLLGSLHFEGER